MARMESSATASAPSLDDVLTLVRPAVRGEHAYVVGAPPEAEVKLNQNESPFDLPAAIKAELAETLQSIAFNRYPSEQPDALRHALADYTGFTPDGLLLGNGSNELTYLFGMAFVKPGDAVVMPAPMFSLYEKVARLHDADLVQVPPRDDLSFDTDALVAAVEARDPVLTVLTTPNNPTGLAMPFEEVRRVVEAARGIVVVDEAYVEFNPEPSAQTLIADHPHVVVLRTLSKGFGLAGLRLGYLMAHPELVHELMKARLPFMVDRLSEAAGLALLEHPDLLAERVAKMEAARDELYALLDTTEGVEVWPSQANFVLFATGVPPKELQARMLEEGVLIRQMSGYPELPRHCRVNAGTKAENKAFQVALERALQSTRPA
jgi:histidinol-phosphate aminotransferase